MLPSDDGCSGASGPSQINVGGIAPAQQGGGGSTTQERSRDMAAARVATGSNSPPRVLKKGETCGDKNGAWGDAKCAQGSQCKQRGTWWGCL
jgi:hypothetical protein